MPYSCTTRFGKRLEARMEPWLDSEGDLARLLDAIGQMFQPLLEVAEEEGEDGTAGYVPAYGNLMNPVTCPGKDLPWLSQFVGVEIRSGATEEEARAELKAESGMARGTRVSLEALLNKALGLGPKGELLFVILERTKSVEGDDAYWVTIIIPTGHLTSAVYEEVNATMPAGVQYTVIERSGTWFVGAKKWSAITAGKTWAEMTEGNY